MSEVWIIERSYVKFGAEILAVFDSRETAESFLKPFCKQDESVSNIYYDGNFMYIIKRWPVMKGESHEH